MQNKIGTIKQKFAGPKGARAILEALRSAKITHCDRRAVSWLAKRGKLKVFKSGQKLIVQGGYDASAYVLLAGSVDVCTNGNTHHTRSIGDHVGEMAAIDVGQPRSATVMATEEVAAIELTEGLFLDFLEKFPFAAIEVAKELARRLRQRDDFFRRVNAKPRLFIISASESKKVAESLQRTLKLKGLVVDVWWADQTFKASEYPLPNLVERLNTCDFALAIADPVDRNTSRKQSTLSPRDNVILEFGMAVSALGLERTFYLRPARKKDQKIPLKMPSDLVGLKYLEYTKLDRFHATHIASAVQQVVERVEALGTLQTLKPKNHI